ncbi:MAG: glycosyltransferase family 2 protein [Desulfobacterota bacterium]|nr:glycosyltransferase family 2 protein [Thermodesulfobacteriota bacterium]
MKPFAAILIHSGSEDISTCLRSLRTSTSIEKILLLSPTPCSDPGIISIVTPYPFGGHALQQALHHACSCPYLLVITNPTTCRVTTDDVARALALGTSCGAGIWYADYYVGKRLPATVMPVCPYQLGSIRDDFDFGPAHCYATAQVMQALERFGQLKDTRWAGLYELRLKVSCTAPVQKVAEPLFYATAVQRSSHFMYIDPKNLAYQKEMEYICTEHLRRINALCTHDPLPIPEDRSSYPVVASVVIPVRNRERTIADAIRSALSQTTDFPFNILVVDNHSTDQTGTAIERIACTDRRVIRIVPDSADLGIGGCWNIAVQSAHCGTYVCQLDSDDLYADTSALAAMVSLLREGFGMVVGSYRVVNFSLEEIPPGVVDHREWSDENGRNNLLRVAGIGAPRAFPTVLLRRFPFPNVSYGEDYAIALRIARDYRVGRIYTPLYLCRRWEDNTDAALTPEQTVRFATFKDTLRTREITERQKAAA